MTGRCRVLAALLVMALAGCASPISGQAIGPSIRTGGQLGTSITTDNTRIFCTLALKALDYLDTVKADFDKHDGSAPVNLLEAELAEADTTLQTVYFSYLGTQIDLAVFDSFHSFRVLAADFAGSQTKNSDLPHRLRNYSAIAEDFRRECSSFV